MLEVVELLCNINIVALHHVIDSSILYDYVVLAGESELFNLNARAIKKNTVCTCRMHCIYKI